MWVFLTAVLTASLLGSTHCIGMCGPLAVFASGAGDLAPPRQVWISSAIYHLGRMTTYLIAGLIAGAIGSLVDAGGEILGFQLAAARIVGLLMVVFGLLRVGQLVFRFPPADGPLRPSRIGGLLTKLRPAIFRMPPRTRALVVGMLTTLLPCGWLYLFALVAAGTGSLWIGPIVMFAFWLGTVPALTALITGTVALSARFKTVIPTAAAILLIFAGVFTMTGRGFAELHSLGDLGSLTRFESTSDAIQAVESASETQLPCCAESTAAATQPGLPAVGP